MSKLLIIERADNDTSAISVYDEAATVFWQSIRDNKGLCGKMSIHQLRELFDKAVIPAIKEVRKLDRAHKLDGER